MEIFGGILAVIIVAILISALFYYGLKSRGPWGSFWTFFLVLLLIIWAANIWVRPIGPVYWGVAWVPLVFIGIIFALLLAAIPTDTTRTTRTDENLTDAEIRANRPGFDRRHKAEVDDATAAAAVGWMFWVFLTIIFVSILVGYAF